MRRRESRGSLLSRSPSECLVASLQNPTSCALGSYTAADGVLVHNRFCLLLRRTPLASGISRSLLPLPTERLRPSSLVEMRPNVQ